MDFKAEFDRNSCRYKQFKIHNTRRTSTPQPSLRPKYQSIRRDPPMIPIPQPPSSCPDVDTTYVSYVQWRHYLVVPNSARKFKVRGTSAALAAHDTIISGNFNMASAAITCGKLEKRQKHRIKPKTEELMNSRFVVEEFRELREHLEARNRRIVDVVIPAIKRSLKRFVVGNKVEERVNYISSPPKACKRERMLPFGGSLRQKGRISSIGEFARKSLRRMKNDDEEVLLYAVDDDIEE